MKRIFPIFCVAALFASCEKEPDLDNVTDQVVTYTQYDSEVDFADFSTFYVADKVAAIGGSTTKDLDSIVGDQLINKVTTEMLNRGYTQTTDKTTADLGIQISYVETRHTVDTSNYSPYWWIDYPGYWGPNYWGPWYGSWYYPYNNYFSYYNGALLCDMVDLTTADQTSRNSDQQLPVIWQSYSVGLVNASQKTNVENMLSGIEQAFEQSQYIKK